jgi:hypothetical protein
MDLKEIEWEGVDWIHQAQDSIEGSGSTKLQGILWLAEDIKISLEELLQGVSLLLILYYEFIFLLFIYLLL